MSELDEVVKALEMTAIAVAELEGVAPWEIDAAVQIVGLAQRLLTEHEPKAIDDVIDTLAEIGKGALDAQKFGGAP